jgi:hypothetical protein
MLRMVSGLLLTVACLNAQGLRDLLLPENRHIVGTVVDPEGKPIPGAPLEHADYQQTHQTDSNGRFELDTQAPVIVIRKAGPFPHAPELI